MSSEMVRLWIEIGAGAVILIAVTAVTGQRILGKRDLTPRSLHFLTLTVLIAAIVILALEGVLDGGVAAALLGAVAGYVIASLARAEDGAPPSA